MPERDEHYWKYRVFHEPHGHPAEEVSGHPVPIDANYFHNEDGDYQYYEPLNEVEGLFFVLRPENDEYARIAMAAYAYACRRKYPVLASDIIHMIEGLEWEEDTGGDYTPAVPEGVVREVLEDMASGRPSPAPNVVEFNRNRNV